MLFTGQNQGKIPLLNRAFLPGLVYQHTLAFDDIIQVLEFMGMVGGMASRFNKTSNGQEAEPDQRRPDFPGRASLISGAGRNAVMVLY